MIKNSNVQGLKNTKKIKDNIIQKKGVRNLFKLKIETDETSTKNVKNHFLIYIKFEWKHQ